MIPKIDEGARGSAIAETRRVATADTDVSCTRAYSDASFAAIGVDSLAATADSLVTAVHAGILDTVTLGFLLVVFFTHDPIFF